MNSKGHLYWITGLSGAGKTTISTLLYNYLRKKQDNIFLIDGDKIREVYQNTDYTEDGMEKISYMNMRLCKMLADQGIDVIIAVIGMRDTYREWNRKNIENYHEIYLEVPMTELIRRDSKQIYSRALRKELTNVYGIDIPYEEPKNPDVHIINEIIARKRLHESIDFKFWFGKPHGRDYKRTAQVYDSGIWPGHNIKQTVEDAVGIWYYRCGDHYRRVFGQTRGIL